MTALSARVRRRAGIAPLLLAALALVPPARAQLGMGLDLGSGFNNEDEREKKKPKPRPVAPFAEALFLTMSPLDWVAVGLSTSAPREELSRYVHQGLFRLELVELVLIGSRSKIPLKSLVGKREDGKPLAQLAKDNGLAYEPLYQDALDLRDRVERRLATLPVSTETVSVPISTGTASVRASTAPAAAP